MRKIDILFIMPYLNRGGAEGVVVNIANRLDRNQFRVSFLVFQKRGDLVSTLRDDIKLYSINSPTVLRGVLKTIKIIYRLNPDIVFSGISNLNLYLSASIPILKSLKKEIKFVARQPSILSLNNRQEKLPKVYEFLHKSIYKNYDLIICQSKFMREDLIKNYNFPPNRSVVINNPIDIDRIKELSLQNINYPFSKNKIRLISVGNLRYEKRFDLLLKTFALLDNRYTLTIIGDGVKRVELEELAVKLNIENRVAFLGYQKNPYPYIKEADIYILTSEYEGFPNAILEANLLGLFSIGFKSIGGVTEIIKNGVNGYLVEFGNIKLLAKTIEEIDVKNLNREAISKSVERFSISKIITHYQECLKGLIYEKNSNLQ
jgi:glycosyltransferase involved in cell wall biosynthesis